MNIVWCSWKDIRHPLAGGAEIITHNILSHLASEGHTVTLLTAEYAGSSDNGLSYSVIRMGNRYSVYYKVYRYFNRYLTETTDIVIDEMNTIPFFVGKLTKKSAGSYLFVHQLCREIWFYQMPFPFSLFGYIAEPIYLRLLARIYPHVIAMSHSTELDLRRYGFRKNTISIISEGIELTPISELGNKPMKDPVTILSLGAVRPMKRTLETVKAYEILLKQPAAMQRSMVLQIVGDVSEPYAKKVIAYASSHLPKNSYEIFGRVAKDEKIRLMGAATLITVTSVKEGWGLIVTEANSQGTPAVVYDVDGLRDSVKNNETGIVCSPTPSALSESIVALIENGDGNYQRLRNNAWVMSKDITFDRSYQDFKSIISRPTS